jgi:N-acetylmuramoyl-L-alanine amidase
VEGGRQRIIVLDPGHGGPEVGAGGAGLSEKFVNLYIAQRLRRMLEEAGYRAVLTRETDARVFTLLPHDPNSTARPATEADLQARVDLANQAQADVFISLHNNGSNDSGLSGTEVWYNASRPFSALNLVLAQEVLNALVEEIRAAGHPAVNRGLKDDARFRFFNGRYYPLFVLGPPREANPQTREAGGMTRATQMPGILGETLFLSHAREAQLLRLEEMQEAIARGYFTGIQRYFARMDAGEFHYSPQ